MTRYQWLVVFAAWLGWGFDIFDGLLFNYVASNCVPTLLHIPIGTPEATQMTIKFVGVTASVLLLGWAAGGMFFGKIADRFGRTRTLLLTMLCYSFGTAACAFAPNMEFLILFRFISSLGIGGEWGGGRGDGRRSRSGEEAGRGGRVALHFRAGGTVSRYVRQCPDFGQSVERQSGDFLALRLFVRPDSRFLRLHHSALREGAGALAGCKGARRRN